MTSLRPVAALSVAALLAACGGDSSSSEKKLDLQGFIDGYSDTMCSALVHCSCTDATALADCKAVYETYMSYTTAEMFLSHPGARLSPTAARTCLADLSTTLQACPSPTGGGSMTKSVSPLARASAPVAAADRPPVAFMQVPSCTYDLLIEGLQAVGEYCSAGEECAAGLVCDRSQHKCVAAPIADASCMTTSGCAEGLYCGSADHVCHAIPAANAACDAADQVCATGTTCVQVSGTYTCVAPHAVDQDCTDDAGCAAGLYCDSTCKTLIPDGGDCDYGEQCAHAWCKSDKCADPGFCASVLDWAD
jgi:hypothetical protein